MNTNKPNKALIYCRTAIKNQHSQLEQQGQRCRAFAAEHEMQVIDAFSDDGYSGDVSQRPGLNKLLEKLATIAGNPDQNRYALIIDDPTRLTRDLSHYLELKQSIAAFGAVLCSVAHGFSDSPDTAFKEHVLLTRQKLEDQLEADSEGA